MYDASPCPYYNVNLLYTCIIKPYNILPTLPAVGYYLVFLFLASYELSNEVVLSVSKIHLLQNNDSEIWALLVEV